MTAWPETEARSIETNGITLNTWVIGEGPLVVLCHGFPELAYSWRHQLGPLVEAGYRVAVPDMRGYGGSSRPAAVDAYDIVTLAEDIVGLVRALGEQKAVLVGHDWGAAVVWHTALAHPGSVRAVAGLSVPFMPRPPASPLEIIRRRMGEDYYMSWFQVVGPADRALMVDIERTLTATGQLTADWAANPDRPVRPSWLSESDLDVYAESFRRSTFTPGLNYYRNIDRNWRLTAALDGARIHQPALFLTGSEDIVGAVMSGAALEEFCDDLRGIITIPQAGHWVQQEVPGAVSDALVGFLAGL
jgi:pimeloyl-ACP methyl ester carboxylesterase